MNQWRADSGRGSFELPAFSTLDTLATHVRAIVHRRLFATVLERLSEQQHQQLDAMLCRGLQNQAAGPVIFIEVSAPMEVGFGAAELGLLQQELIGATDQKVWSFVTRYEENRIRVFGRVGPFRIAPSREI